MDKAVVKFDNMCRGCKEGTESMISIDQEEICQDSVITLASMLMECTTVQVSDQYDGLPREMCLRCIEQLKSAFTFKRQCEETDSYLRKCLVEEEIKPDEWIISKNELVEDESQNNNITLEPGVENSSKQRKSKRTKKQDTGINTVLNNIKNESISKRGRVRKPVVKYEPESDYDYNDVGTADVFDSDQEWTASDNEIIKPDEIKPRFKTHDCTHCSETFKTKSGLKQHLTVHDEETPFVCEVCPERFSRREQLIEHTKGHLNELNHDCEVCGQKLETIEQLAKHKFSKHTTPKESTTKKKDKEKVKYKCDTCGKMFSSPKHRENHVYLAHNKIYYCKSCQMPFCGREAFYHHNTRSNECSKKYLCPDCGARFSATSALKVHIRRHRGEKPFKCQYCEKGFSRKFDLITHETRHRGEKNHLCPICGKGFNRRHMLTIHMRTHTGEKPYKCSYCDAAFTQNNDLKTHIRRHTGERFVCDICNEKFLMHYLLSKHKRVVHGINIPPAKPILSRVPIPSVEQTTADKTDVEIKLDEIS